MAEVFQDGEPVDPLKLQKLQDQITAVSAKASQAFDLGSRLDSEQRQIVFHVKAGVEPFEGGFTSGQTRTQQIDVDWSGDYTNVYTTCTVRTKSPNLNIRATLTGDIRQPSIAVWCEKKFESTLNVHWISVATKPVDNL